MLPVRPQAGEAPSPVSRSHITHRPLPRRLPYPVIPLIALRRGVQHHLSDLKIRVLLQKIHHSIRVILVRVGDKRCLHKTPPPALKEGPEGVLSVLQGRTGAPVDQDAAVPVLDDNGVALSDIKKPEHRFPAPERTEQEASGCQKEAGKERRADPESAWSGSQRFPEKNPDEQKQQVVQGDLQKGRSSDQDPVERKCFRSTAEQRVEPQDAADCRCRRPGCPCGTDAGEQKGCQTCPQHVLHQRDHRQVQERSPDRDGKKPPGGDRETGEKDTEACSDR